jgi:ABC-type multidrug transport system ATPase subunit/ABC-type transport system involved in multi-copper enzyme maturation permease subunit
MIEIRNVSKRYGRRVALSGVSLTLQPGEVTLLLGANGAGKSTLLRCILGITDFAGAVRVEGLDPLRDGPSVRALIGYMPQTGGLHPDLTVADTMRFYAAIRRAPRERGDRLLEEAGLDGHAAVAVGDLSGGLRQRLGFALALLTDPRILVLDEPSASLDAASREWLAKRLRAAADDGRVVLVSTHAGQELLAAGDRRIVLEDGQVIASNPPDASEPPPSTDVRAIVGPPVDVRAAARLRAGSAAPLVRKELTDAFANRWLIAYAAVLGVLGVAAASAGIESASGLALQAFGRTTATLMNLCLLLAPLVAVLMGAASIAGERERGTLEHLLAQPLTRTRLLLAKHAGLVISLTAATLAGFLPAGLFVVAAAGVGVLGHYLIFPGIAVLVGMAMAGIGMLISVSSRSAVQAQGTAVFAWFGLVLLYDLLLVGVLAVSGVPVALLGAALVANPVDAARVLGILALEPDLYLLGPAGAYLTAELSRSGAALLLAAALVFWAAAPLVAAVIRFQIPGAWRARRTAAPDGCREPHPRPLARGRHATVKTEEVTIS